MRLSVSLLSGRGQGDGRSRVLIMTECPYINGTFSGAQQGIFQGRGPALKKRHIKNSSSREYSLGYYSGIEEAIAKGDFQERGGIATTVMATTNLLIGLGVVGRLKASFCDVRGPTMAGSDATDNFFNFTPLDWPRKTSARLKFC